MALVDEIKDEASLKAWLDTQPREVAVDIAHRAAMRVLPIYWEAVLRWQKPESRAIPILRANLVVGAARFVPTPVIRTAAEAAHSAADATAATAATTATAATATADAATATAQAAQGAAYAAAYDLTSDDAAGTAACAATAAETKGDAIWSALRDDARQVKVKNDPGPAPLWLNGENPFAAHWQEVTERLPQDDPVWEFWRRWYKGALDGEQTLDPDLIKEIATQDEAFWEGTDDEVNARIAAIVAEFAKKRSGNAERVFVNADGLYETEPILDIAPQILSTALDRIRDALAEFQAIPEGDNLRGACDREITRVDDYLTRYHATPIRIYEVLVRTIRRIDACCDEGELTLKDDRLEDFRTELDSSALDILQNAPSVKEAISLRAIARFDRLIRGRTRPLPCFNGVSGRCSRCRSSCAQELARGW